MSWLWDNCRGVFAHPTGKVANFVYYDGRAKSKKWLATLYPLSQNNWDNEPPRQNPGYRRVSKVPGCDYDVPPARNRRYSGSRSVRRSNSPAGRS